MALMVKFCCGRVPIACDCGRKTMNTLDAINYLATQIQSPTKVVFGENQYTEFNKHFSPPVADGNIDPKVTKIMTENGELDVEVVKEDIIAVK